jgi:hypothetical protein
MRLFPAKRFCKPGHGAFKAPWLFCLKGVKGHGHYRGLFLFGREEKQMDYRMGKVCIVWQVVGQGESSF